MQPAAQLDLQLSCTAGCKAVLGERLSCSRGSEWVGIFLLFSIFCGVLFFLVRTDFRCVTLTNRAEVLMNGHSAAGSLFAIFLEYRRQACQAAEPVPRLVESLLPSRVDWQKGSRVCGLSTVGRSLAVSPNRQNYSPARSRQSCSLGWWVAKSS